MLESSERTNYYKYVLMLHQYASSRINFGPLSQSSSSESDLKNCHDSRYCLVFQVIQVISLGQICFAEKIWNKLTSAAASFQQRNPTKPPDFKTFFLSARLARLDHVHWQWTWFHSNIFDEIPCKLDSTENLRSFEKHRIHLHISVSSEIIRIRSNTALVADKRIGPAHS